jgi:hypothetical protein
MYVYICAYIYIHTHIHIWYICVYVYICTHIHICIYVYNSLYYALLLVLLLWKIGTVYKYIYIFKFIFLCIYVYLYVYMYIHTHTHAHTNILTHIHLHIFPNHIRVLIRVEKTTASRRSKTGATSACSSWRSASSFPKSVFSRGRQPN